MISSPFLLVGVTGFKKHPDASVGVKSHFARENRLHSCDLKQVESTITSAKNKRDAEASLLPLVGVTGFEPAASWSRTMRTTKLCHTPILSFSVSKFEMSFDPREVPNRFGHRKVTKEAYIPNCATPRLFTVIYYSTSFRFCQAFFGYLT